MRYGNMVHNVRGIDALLADGSAFHFGASDRDRRRACRALSRTGAPRACRGAARGGGDRARWPKVLRRVRGYNIDMVQPGAEGAPLAHNLAHLLVGSEGTLAYSRRIHLDLAPLPQHKTLGVCHFPTFPPGDGRRPAYRQARRPAAVELVDRTMIELARGNAAFQPIVDRFVKGEPGGDAAGRIRRRRSRRAARQAQAAGGTDGRSRISRRRGRDDRLRPAEASVGGAARPASTS